MRSQPVPNGTQRGIVFGVKGAAAGGGAGKGFESVPQISTKVPRMQNQARRRAAAEEPPEALHNAQQVVDKKELSRPVVMRQFELIERVKRYNPNSNEALLDRA